MKYILLLLLPTLLLTAQDKKNEPKRGSLEWLEMRQKLARAYMRESIPYFKAKYEKIALKNLEDLNKEKTRYEAGLKKLQKGSKRYKAREAEYQVILNKIKAQKMILVYAKMYTAQLDAYDNADT